MGIGQRLYKHDGKLSKRAQEVTGIPLINYNLQPPAASNKEPLKRTFSACAATSTSPEGQSQASTSLTWPWPSGSSNYQQTPSQLNNTLEAMPELLQKPLL